MPGSYTRPPSVGVSWDAAAWEDYRQAVLACRDRDPDSAWWELTGRHCLTMADRNIERLRSSVTDV